MSVSLHYGASPLLVSMPHIGTTIPEEFRANYVPRALEAEDTDWHLAELYDFLPSLGASVLKPTISRYVIDLNRPDNDAPMYPGAANTELCPTHFFTGEPLYLPTYTVTPIERQRRLDTYWRPYHTALRQELDRIKAIHGYVLLWDAHSIRSELPWLFEGVLPSLNIGTASGASAHSDITSAVAAVCEANSAVSHAVNGRFKGGYITRNYGDPANHIHAIQLEKCQNLYMQETAPYAFNEQKANQIRPQLKSMIVSALDACKKIYGH